MASPVGGSDSHVSRTPKAKVIAEASHTWVPTIQSEGTGGHRAAGERTLVGVTEAFVQFQPPSSVALERSLPRWFCVLTYKTGRLDTGLKRMPCRRMGACAL